MRGACISAGMGLCVLLNLAVWAAETPAPIKANPASAAVPAAVIGFVGGHVKADAKVHSTVQLADQLRNIFPSNVYIRVYQNHHGDEAYNDLMHYLDRDHNGTLSASEKHEARIVIYGHSWGASETVTLARKLGRENIPVLLTIQVDSVAKHGENDALIPPNVEQAVNFYQPHGLIHGRAEIHAADAERTQIVGNFRFDYSEHPVACNGYPWFNHVFIRPHIEIECDPRVWNRVQAMIESRLAPAVETAASAVPVPEH